MTANKNGLRRVVAAMRFAFILSLAAASLGLATIAWAQEGADTETILYRFQGGSDGSEPFSGVILDSAGNLYGTAQYAGIGGLDGVVLELSPNPHGGWTETVLYSFTNSTDGGTPTGGLIFDAAGNLYGTAAQGGDLSQCGGGGCGVVFKLTPSGGSWTESVIYTFEGGALGDGSLPQGQLTFDAAGNLYGITYVGGNTGCGTFGCGTVYKLSPNSSGPWTETLLHVFSGGTDGAKPFAGVTLDSAGNVYGTATQGGIVTGCSGGCGVAFELSPLSGGGFKETVMHRFTDGADGGVPASLLLPDGAGNFYGTTTEGGSAANCNAIYGTCGLVFELSPLAGGAWKETVIHDFGGFNGAAPTGDLISDASGNLYGGTRTGGKFRGGTIFELSPHPLAPWTETVLFDFTALDGGSFFGPLAMDPSGNLFGTSEQSGSHSNGNVYEISPPAARYPFEM